MHKVTLALRCLFLQIEVVLLGLLQHRCQTRVVAYNVTPDLGEEETPLERVTFHRLHPSLGALHAFPGEQQASLSMETMVSSSG